jgi:hypothetical protein
LLVNTFLDSISLASLLVQHLFSLCDEHSWEYKFCSVNEWGIVAPNINPVFNRLEGDDEVMGCQNFRFLLFLNGFQICSQAVLPASSQRCSQ